MCNVKNNYMESEVKKRCKIRCDRDKVEIGDLLGIGQMRKCMW